MERLYAVQDEAQDWLASPAQQVEGWPRITTWSQDGLIAWCTPFGRHSGKENLSLSYPILLCSFNFCDSRVTIETPHTTPIRHLQWAPMSTGRFLLSADDAIVCIWQIGETLSQCTCVDIVQLPAPILLTWLSSDEPRVSALSNMQGATLDSRFDEAARAPSRPLIDGCKDGWLGVSSSGQVMIATQHTADNSFMTARYNIAPCGIAAADLSFANGKPLLGVVTNYTNAISAFELTGDRTAILVMSPACISRGLLEPTVRILAVRASPYTPAQFLLLTIDALDVAPRIEMWEVLTEPLQTGTSTFARVAGPYSQLDATAIEYISPALIAVTAKSGKITLLSTRDLSPVVQEKAPGLVSCTRSPNCACMAALDTNGTLSVWRLPVAGAHSVANRFVLASVLGVDPSELLVALQTTSMQEILELQVLLMEPLGPSRKGYYTLHMDAFKSSVNRLVSGPEAQVPTQARLSLAFILDALRSCMIKPFSLPTGAEIWGGQIPIDTLYKPAVHGAQQQVYVVDHGVLQSLFLLTEWVLDFAVYLVKSAHMAALLQRDSGAAMVTLQVSAELPVPRTVEAFFTLYARQLPRLLSPAFILLYDDDIRLMLLELLVISHNVREQFSQRKLLPPKHTSYGIPALKALHELLVAFYTKARLTSPLTPETIMQILQMHCTDIASLTLPAVVEAPELDPTRLFATLDLIPPPLPFVAQLSLPSEGDVLMLSATDAARESARDVVSRAPLQREGRHRVCSRCARLCAEGPDAKLATAAEVPWPTRWAFCCPMCGGRWIPYVM